MNKKKNREIESKTVRKGRGRGLKTTQLVGLFLFNKVVRQQSTITMAVELIFLLSNNTNKITNNV